MLASLCLLTAIQVPASAPQPIEVGFQITAGDFVAHNYSDRSQALVFHHDGNHAMYVLLPGEDVAWSIPSNLSTSVELEIVSRGVPGTWLVSDALGLDGLVACNVPAVWLQGTTPRSVFWIETGSGFVACATKPSLCAEDLGAGVSSSSDEPTFESMQVPVITPVNLPSGGLPPKIEPVPLPPV